MTTAVVTQIAYAVQTLFDPAGTVGRLVDLGKLANYGLLTSFTPAYLFTAGINGTWYDPSDINLTWRRNLLTYSEQFDNAAWVKGNATITANAVIAPDGSMTADKLVPNTIDNQHTVGQVLPSNSYTYSVYVKAGEYNLLSISVYDGLSWKLAAIFNAASGAIERSFAGSATILSAGSGWYKCTVSGATSATATFNLQVTNSITDWASSFAGDGYSGIYIWGAQLEQGSTATPYQRITDGVQDYLQYQALPVLYRDAAGTQPVTAVEQPVGLMLDKSKGLVLGPELVTNGDFSSDTWWLKGAGCAITGGAGVATAAASGSGWYKTGLLAIGNYYEITFTVVSCSAGAFRVGFFATAYSQAYSAPGTYTVRLRADGTGFVVETVGITTGSIDNVSVKQVSGNHAFNPSGNSANFPVLSARYNLLTNTEDFSDAVWGKANYASLNLVAHPNPFGDAQSWLAIPSTASNAKTIDRTDQLPATHSKGIIAKAAGYRYLQINWGSAFSTAYVNFDVQTGQVTAQIGAVGAVTPLGDGWFFLSATVTGTAVLGAHGYTIVPTGTSIRGSGMVGDGVSGMYLWGADLRVANDGVNLPAYQRVNTSTDYDTVGFKPYLKFNGVNQWLQTNSIDFSYSDKMFVSAGVRKLSDAAGMVLETSANYNSNNGAIILFTDTKVNFGESGTGGNAVNSSGYTAPVTHVISATADRAGTTGPTTFTRLGVNGLDNRVSYAYVDNDAGNFGNYPLYIGARAGSSLWFNGRLYGMVVAGKQASAAEIQDTEKYMNLKTTAYN